MPSTARWTLSALLVLALPATLHAQSTDVVEVASGDRITGDVRRLDRGQLAFATASAGPGHQRFAGTISIVWTEVVSLTSAQNFDIELASGERFAGSISSPSAGQLVVLTASGPTRPIAVGEFVWIVPIEDGFRGRTTGSIDFGLSFTNAHWEMLVAVRNLFRDDLLDSSVYDELLVVRPPKRVVGGVTLKF